MLPVLLALTFSGYVAPLPKIVIYEANLRAEGSGGGFQAFTKRLPSIKKLGVNTIWLMPIQPVGKLRSAGGLGSPYSVADFDRINPEFGTASDLQGLISKAHQLKMAVLIDWVANHTAWDNPWIPAHPDWYTKDSKGNFVIPAGTNWNDVADLNFDNLEMRKSMVASMEGWVKRFGIDGFRCDTADYVPKEFWKQAIARLRSTSGKPILMLAEGFRPDHYAAGFDLTYGWNFYDSLVKIFKGDSATILASAAASEAKGSPAGARRLRFITNHDKAAWEGTPTDFFKSPTGVQVAFVITALYGGTPLIYSGQEVAWPNRIPIFDQSKINFGDKPEVAKWLQKILSIRSSHEALQSGALTDLSTNDVVAFQRQQGRDNVLVIVNVRSTPTSFDSANLQSFKWRDEMTGRDFTLPDKLTLDGFSFRILSRK